MFTFPLETKHNYILDPAHKCVYRMYTSKPYIKRYAVYGALFEITIHTKTNVFSNVLLPRVKNVKSRICMSNPSRIR